MTDKKQMVQYQITAIVEVEVTDEILSRVWSMALDLPDSLSGVDWEDRPWLAELGIRPRFTPADETLKLPRVVASRL